MFDRLVERSPSRDTEVTLAILIEFRDVESSSSLHTYTLPSFQRELTWRMISDGSNIRRVAEINRNRQDVNSIPWIYGAAS